MTLDLHDVESFGKAFNKRVVVEPFVVVPCHFGALADGAVEDIAPGEGRRIVSGDELLDRPLQEEQRPLLVRHGDEEVTVQVRSDKVEISAQCFVGQMLEGFHADREVELLVGQCGGAVGLNEVSTPMSPSLRYVKAALPISVYADVSFGSDVVEQSSVIAAELENAACPHAEAAYLMGNPSEARSVKEGAKAAGEQALVVCGAIHGSESSALRNVVNKGVLKNPVNRMAG